MTNTLALVALVVLVSGAIVLPQQAPPAGAPALYKSSAELVAALKQGAGGAQTAAVSNTDRYRNQHRPPYRGRRAADARGQHRAALHHRGLRHGRHQRQGGAGLERRHGGGRCQPPRHKGRCDSRARRHAPLVQGRGRFGHLSGSAIRRSIQVAR